MYRLEVFHAGSSSSVHTEHLQRATDAMTRIAELLKKHHRCEKVVLFLDNARLFAVDRKGNRIDD